MARKPQVSANQLAFDLWDIPDEAPPAPKPPTTATVPESETEAPPSGGVTGSDLVEAMGERLQIITVGRQTSAPVEPAGLSTRSRAPRGPVAARGEAERVRDGVAAAQVLHELRTTGQPASDAQRETLARWPGWGAVPALFDESSKKFATERDKLKAMWSEDEWAAARRTTINAHYTDPAYVQAMWRMLGELGLTEGRVLEPGSGSGNFLGAAPEGIDMVGVEVDPVTAEISQHLHPHATVRAESFATTRVDGDGFDAVIGNVPFANTQLYDPAHNPQKFSIHNHFIAKSIDFTKPGGLVAVLSSRYTLDAKSPAVRQRLFETADLVGAVRLPTGAHKTTAGTEVVTDLLLFRKRRYGETPGDDSWLRTTALTVGEGSVEVNSYFVDQPDAVVGEPVIAHGMYGANELRVMHRGMDLVGDVQSAIVQLTQRAKDAGMVWDAAGQKVEYRATEARTATGEATIIGHLSFEDGEVWAEALTGRIVVEAPAKVKTELVLLLELRDRAKTLLEAEGDEAAAPETLEHLREQLGEAYQQYRDTYGPINRVDLVPVRGRATGEDGDEAMRRKYPPVMQMFRNDPEAATVFALEVFDEETQRAKRADIFHKRVIGGAAAAALVESLPDALAVVMDTEGTIDLDKIAGLLRTTAGDVHTRLIDGELAFLEPPAAGQNGPQLVQRAEYLSGNVRKKLATAKLAASTDERYARSVAALEKVIPEEFGPAEIDVRFGATWVPAKYYEQFIQDHTGASGTVAVERPGNGDWAVKMGNVPYHRANEIGTPDVSVKTLIGKVLNHGRLVVERKDSEGKSYVDVEASELLREKASNLVEAFQSWLWAEPERAAVCAEIYNDRFNAMVLRSYDDVQLSLPMKADSFTPRPHQVAAVARMINEPAVGLFHEVGAGKTAEMVMGVMELRRLKLVSKPAIVVPNHMLDQFTREFKQIYPLARVLSAGSAEMSMAKGKDARRVFVERARTGDWDAVIITRSAFSRLGLSPATEAQFLQNKISEERARLEAIAGSDLGRSRVKGQEKAILRLEEKLKEALDMPRDEGLFFEKTGIDYLCVDEAHGYKNLQVTSSYEGLSKAIGSNLALDLDMKLRYLRGLGRERVVTLATATPMANGLQELYVMQSYLRPDLLEEAGLTNADEWARQFTEEVTQAEIGPAGDYRMKTRIGKFRNLPELLTMFHVAGDVKTAKDLGLPVPLLAERADGRRAPEVVVIPHTTASLEFQKAVGDRAAVIRGGAVDPSVDNMLKLSSNSRDAALDMRLFDPEWRPGEDEHTKASVAAERIMRIHKEHEARPYTDALGDQHPTLGGVQLVFADRGTPSEVRFSAYRELKEQLVARGMPAERIRFIHDAATDAEKDAMFALCRSGAVSVIVGSTEKMGTGTNIQDRALALHHLDCPWRPADVIQREGRLIRQGNQNLTVQVLRYVQSGSFDAFMWQTVTRKAIAAEQIMSGKITAREIEMVSSEVFTYAEAMAMSNDDPRIIERIEMDAEIQRLKRLERGHRRERIAIGGQVSELNYKIEHMQKQIPVLEQLLAKRSDTTGDAFFGHVVNGPTAQPLHHPAPFTGRAEFGQALKNALLEHSRHAPGSSGEFRPIYSVWAGVGGVAFKVSHGVSIGTGVHMVRLSLQHPTQPYQSLDFEEVRIPVGELSEIAPHALAMRLERKVQGLVEYRAGLEQIIEDTRTEVGKLQLMQAEPFGRKGELEELTTRREQLIAAMTGEDGHPKQPGPSPHSSTPPPAPEVGPAIGR